MRKIFALVLGLVFVSAGLVASKAESKSLSAKEAVLGFYKEVFNGHNVNAIDKYTVENVVDHNPDPGQKPGRQGLKEAFKGWFAAFPDLKIEVKSTVTEGDLVAARVVLSGTQKGSYMGMPASGKKFEIGGIDLVRVENGKALERWGYFDGQTMAQQLGMGMGGPGGKCPMDKAACKDGKKDCKAQCPMDKDGKHKGKKDKKEKDEDEDDDDK